MLYASTLYYAQNYASVIRQGLLLKAVHTHKIKQVSMPPFETYKG